MACKDGIYSTEAIVVAAATIINIIYNGTYYCTGLFFHHFIYTFQQSKSATAFIISLMNGSLYLSGFITAPLIMRYGSRPVAIFGSLVSSTGLLLSSISSSLWVLYITFGVITGFSWGFLMNVGSVSVHQHTSKRRALASGILFIGSGLGSIIYPLIFRWTESMYGWRGTLLIMAGLQSNCLPASLLLVPAPTSKMKDSPDVDSTKAKNDDPASNGKDVKPTGNKYAKYSHESHEIEMQDLLDKTSKQSNNVQKTINSNNTITHVTYKNEKKDTPFSSLCCFTKKTQHMLYSGGLASVACIVAYVFRFGGVSVYYSLLPVRIASTGLSSNTSAYLLSVLGIGEIVGRVGSTCIAHLHNRLPFILFVTATVTSGIIEASLIYAHSIMHMVALLSAAGIALGVVSSVACTVVRDLVGIKNFPWVLGFAYGASGIGNIVILQFLAWLWDETNNDSLIFVIAGTFLVCSGLTYVIYICFNKKVSMGTKPDELN